MAQEFPSWKITLGERLLSPSVSFFKNYLCFVLKLTWIKFYNSVVAIVGHAEYVRKLYCDVKALKFVFKKMFSLAGENQTLQCNRSYKLGKYLNEVFLDTQL